jgi:hypothetical protein
MQIPRQSVLRLPIMGALGLLILSSLICEKHAHANNAYLDLNERELLQKYMTLCARAAPERIQLMRTLSAVERSYLWRVKLGLYLAQHPNLTTDQQQIVIETLEIATPQLFSVTELNNSALRAKVLEPVETLRQRSLLIFSKSEAAQIFAEIGQSQDLPLLEQYTQLSKLSKGERKKRFNQAPPQEKSDLWRVQFGLNLARHPEWSEPQRSIVLEAIAIATPELYQIPKDRDWTRLVDEPLRVFAQKALQVFSKQEGAALFSELGATETNAHHAQDMFAGGNCSCARESDWCTYNCLATDCTLITWGCGTMGLYSCDGTCNRAN